MLVEFVLNDRPVRVDKPAGAVLLDVLRNDLCVCGVKEGCREGDCGACMVLTGERTETGVEYRTVNSCLFPLAEADGCHIVTIEGLNRGEATPWQEAFVEEGAPHCGYCMPGFMLSLTGELIASDDLSFENFMAAASGNICRCSGYTAIHRALRRVADSLRREPFRSSPGTLDRVREVAARGFLPDGVPQRAAALPLRRVQPDPEAGGSRRIVAGGTDLYVQRAEDLMGEDSLRFLSREPALRGVTDGGEWIEIGAAAPVEALAGHDAIRETIPGFPSLLRLVSSRAIRNRASIGGNLVNASPIGDMTVMLLALNAEVFLERGDAQRAMPLREFFLGYKNLDLQEGEIVRAVRFPVPCRPIPFHFEKVSKRECLDIASVNTAMSLHLEGDVVRDVHLSAGGVAPVPASLTKTSAMLRGARLDFESAAGACESAADEVAPISDMRGSAAYKKKLLSHLVWAHFETLAPACLQPEGAR